jgi:hypothetical protein
MKTTEVGSYNAVIIKAGKSTNAIAAGNRTCWQQHAVIKPVARIEITIEE